jgi:hypothetical protein
VQRHIEYWLEILVHAARIGPVLGCEQDLTVKR